MDIVEAKKNVKSLIVSLLNDNLTEDESVSVYLKIKDIAPDPECLDYIYHSNEFYNEHGELDVDSVVEKCFSYKPIVL